jgi:chemotaxis protein methyltransferase CheR
MQDLFAGTDYDRFKKKILALTSLDLDIYRQPQLQRRIQSLLKKNGVATFEAYFQLLLDHPRARLDFKSDITINTTEFFRDTEQFERLRTTFLPELTQRGVETLRLWSAGCSVGAEAYTLAMMMREYFPRSHFSLLATDIDGDVIKAARQGSFKAHEIQDVPERLKKKYFRQRGDRYELSETIKQTVVFHSGNLLRDPFDWGFDLISCRNVMIYFTQEAKDSLYQKFHHALKIDGLLFVGTSEIILNPVAFGFESAGPFFYRKTTL